ncbi:MAG: STAS domain-containing protein [Trichlorobacter sp.]|jgi:ABC-type transporter Mla MlaB component
MSDLNVSHALSSDNTTLEITLSGRLAIDTAPELLALLQEQLLSARKVRLNVSALSEVDLAGMQLICSACRSALAGSQSFNFSGGLAPCVQEAINNVGLQRHNTCKHSADNPCIWCGGLN